MVAVVIALRYVVVVVVMVVIAIQQAIIFPKSSLGLNFELNFRHKQY